MIIDELERGSKIMRSSAGNSLNRSVMSGAPVSSMVMNTERGKGLLSMM